MDFYCWLRFLARTDGRVRESKVSTLRCPWRINNDAVDIEEDDDAVDTDKVREQ